MVWQAVGAIGGALLGAKSAAADRKAQAESDRMNNMGYMDARPYVTGAYGMGQDALNDALAKGYYSGPTRAGFNDQMRTGLDNRFGLGTRGFGDATNFMNIGSQYAQNTADLYNRAGQDNLAAARNYATANSQPLIDAAMRGANRNLNEVQLPGMSMGASGSGNTNSSRAGVAEAILRRGNAELEADTTARVNRGLMDDYMGQANNQFRNMSDANMRLGNVFGRGFNLGNTATGMQTGVGGAYQGDEQAGFDDARNRFEGERDFKMGQVNNFMSGIMGRAPMNPAMRNPNYHNPMMGALSGGMAGFGFGRKYGPQLSNFFGGGGGGEQAFGGFTSPAMQPYNTMDLL